MMKKVLFMIMMPVLTAFQPSVFAISASLISQTVLDANCPGLNGASFQQDGLVTHNGWQYAAFYAYFGSNRHVCVSRRQLPSGSWEKLVLTDYTQTANDGHNSVSMGICPNDGTIHLSFDHHDNPLHYRVSQTGVATNPAAVIWNADLFYGTRDYLEIGQSVSGLTYPRFWQTPDGDLQMYYRNGASGEGDSFLVDYDGATGTWNNTRMVISRDGYHSGPCGTSTTRNAYLNYPFYGPDGILHWTWCWREHWSSTNHDICHAWSDDGGYTWYNTLGEPQKIQIGTPSQTLLDLSWPDTGTEMVANFSTGQTISISSPGIIAVPITRYYSLMNQQSQAIDPQGRVHTVMYYETDGAGCDVWAGSHYHHYWRKTDGTWNHFQMPITLEIHARPKLFFRSNGDLYMIYDREGSIYVAGASAASNWTDWQYLTHVYNDYGGEAVGDIYRIQQYGDDVLSVMAQVRPATWSDSKPLHVLDFQLND
jgi:hypothetical protein